MILLPSGVIGRVNLKAMFSFVVWVSRILVSIVLLFKSSTAGMQFLLSSAIAVLSSRIDAHTLAGPQGVFAFPQDVVSQTSKASQRCQTTASTTETPRTRFKCAGLCF